MTFNRDWRKTTCNHCTFPANVRKNKNWILSWVRSISQHDDILTLDSIMRWLQVQTWLCPESTSLYCATLISMCGRLYTCTELYCSGKQLKPRAKEKRNPYLREQNARWFHICMRRCRKIRTDVFPKGYPKNQFPHKSAYFLGCRFSYRLSFPPKSMCLVQQYAHKDGEHNPAVLRLSLRGSITLSQCIKTPVVTGWLRCTGRFIEERCLWNQAGCRRTYKWVKNFA